MLDSHCHLDSERFDPDRDDALARARTAGVHGFVLAGLDPPGWTKQRELALRHDDVHFSCGIHPQVAASLTDAALDPMLAELDQALRRQGAPAPVALGETGLDRSRQVPPDSLPIQERAFRAQLALARRLDLPVILHVLRAHDRALAVLREEGLPTAGGVLHSYSGSTDLVPAYAELGLFFSFAGPVTYSGARRPADAVRAVPAERLLVETDAPDQTPQAHKPGRNEPSYLGEIVTAVATARGADPDEIAALTEENARRLFRLGDGG